MSTRWQGLGVCNKSTSRALVQPLVPGNPRLISRPVLGFPSLSGLRIPFSTGCLMFRAWHVTLAVSLQGNEPWRRLPDILSALLTFASYLYPSGLALEVGGSFPSL